MNFLNEYEYPTRVTRLEDGSYCWKCAIGKEYERRINRSALIICGVIALFLLGYGLFLSWHFDDWDSFLIVLGCAAGFMLIAVAIVTLFDRAKGAAMGYYYMRDTEIKTSSRSYFTYRRTRKMIIGKNFIEMRSSIGGPRIYFPEEDLPIVKGFLMSRIPGDAEIRYE